MRLPLPLSDAASSWHRSLPHQRSQWRQGQSQPERRMGALPQALTLLWPGCGQRLSGLPVLSVSGRFCFLLSLCLWFVFSRRCYRAPSSVPMRRIKLTLEEDFQKAVRLVFSLMPPRMERSGARSAVIGEASYDNNYVFSLPVIIKQPARTCMRFWFFYPK